MCFYHEDYDWSASVVDHVKGEAEGDAVCAECHRPIRDGEWRHTVEMQQHEECQLCLDGHPDDDGVIPDPGPHKCDYGETYSYVRCLGCERILEAIKAVEVREGCPPNAQQPSYEGLHEALWDHESKYEYATAAVDMYPELWSHPMVEDLLKYSPREG